MHLAQLYRGSLGIIGGLLLLLILTSCGQKKSDDPITNGQPPTPEPIEKNTQPKPNDLKAREEWIAPLPPEAGVSMSPLEYYRVVVSGSKLLQLPGNKGLLNVWIGDEYFQPAADETMNIADSNIIAVGEYALVEANAPDFEVSPVTSKCLLLHPSGVNAKFYLTALKAGNFEVSATVNLFNTQDCSGPAIPKTANTLKVNVAVNQTLLDEQRRQSFVDIFWAKTTEFWAALLALFFGLILFLVRKQLKRLFGFDKDDS
jgi:hypothetical protein